MSLVLDASAVAAWIYKDETTESIVRLFDLVERSGAVVPSLQWLEVANVLQIGIRRARILPLHRDASLADLAMMPIETDRETERQAWGATLQLADRHRLTTYDASYLELAVRRDVPLATLDRELQRAAEGAGVTLVDL